MLHIEPASKIEEFAALKEPWGALHQKDPAAEFFLTHGWLYSWWETFGRGRELLIIVCRAERDGRVVGILPAYYEKSAGLHMRNTVRLLGSEYVSSDFLGPLVDPEIQGEVIEALLGFFCRGDFSWDLLDFDHLDSQGELPERMRGVFTNGSSHRLVVDSGEICPSLVLPGDWDTTLRNLSAKMRSNIRYSRKALERSGTVEIEKIDSQEQIEEALGDVMRLRRSWIEARGYSNPCPFPLYADFHRRVWSRLVPGKSVHIRFLRIDGRRVAFAYLLRHAGSVYYYQTAFDQEYARHSIGSVLLSHLIEEAISWGCTRFEFLRGDEEYKYKWGEVQERRLVRVKLYNATGAGRWRYGVDAALENTKQMVKGIRARMRAESRSQELKAESRIQ